MRPPPLPFSKTLACALRRRCPEEKVPARYLGGPRSSDEFSSTSTLLSSSATLYGGRGAAEMNSGIQGADNSYSRLKFQIRTDYLQLEVVNALRLGERGRASEMLWNQASLHNRLSTQDFACILYYCAQTPDPVFAMEVWKCMEARVISLDHRCSRLIVQSLSKGGYLKEAFDWLTLIGKSIPGHVLPAYNIFLKGCWNSQSLVDADRCLELMEHQLSGKSEITYCELLKLAVLQNNLSMVHELWKDYTMYYNPSVLALRKFIWSFTRLGDLKTAYVCLKLMVELVTTQGRASVRKSAVGRYRTSRLDIPIPLMSHYENERVMLDRNGLNYVSDEIFIRRKRNPDEFTIKEEDLLCNGVIQKSGSLEVMNILRWSFNDIIHACSRSNDYELAEQLFKEMQAVRLEPSQHTYSGYLKAVLPERGASYCMKVIKEMVKRRMMPYNNTLVVVSMHLIRNLELHLAEVLLQRVSDNSPKYIHPFNAFLAASNIVDAPECALRILAKMKQVGVKPNKKTYESLFSLFGNVNVPYEKGNFLSHMDVTKRVKAIEMDMMKSDVPHSYISMKNVIKAFGAEGMIEEMLQYLDMAGNMLWEINTHQQSALHNISLHYLIKAKECQRAIEVFKKIRLYGLPANVNTYDNMIECCSILTCFRSACAIVATMVRDGFYPGKLTYTALIKVLVTNDDFVGALDLVDLSVLEAVQPDIQLFNTIVREAYSKGRIDIIEVIVERIHKMKIQPNPSTCWYTFCAYAEGDFHSTAMEALHVLSMRMISEEDSVLQEHRAAFEDLVIDENPDAESKIIDVFKESEFIATALLNLRMLAINGTSLSWYPEESLWAKRLSSCCSTKPKDT